MDIDLSEKSYKNIINFDDQVSFTSPNFREEVLHTFKRLFGYQQSLFWLTDGNNNLVDPVALNIDESELRDYMENYYKLDYLHKRTESEKPHKQRVISMFDLLPVEKYENSQFYNDFMAKYRHYHSISILLYNKNQLIGSIGFIGSKKDNALINYDDKCLNIIGRILSIKMTKHLFSGKDQQKLLNKDEYLDIRSSKVKLTRKESEVLELVQKGYSNTEIAIMLFISINTVKKHLQNMYSKFEVSNRTSLIYEFNKT